MQLVANHTIDEIFLPFKCEGLIRANRKIYVKSFMRTRKTEVHGPWYFS